MASLEFWPQAMRFLLQAERKHAGQIALKVLSLLAGPRPPDSKRIQGTKQELWRVDSREYRIVYHHSADSVVIVVIGKRNDDEVYKLMKRLDL